MKFTKDILATLLFASRLNDSINQGIVGVSTTANNITMANIKGNSPGNIIVDSYRCVTTSSRKEQVDALKAYVEEYNLINCPCNYVLPIDKYVIGIIPSPTTVDADNSEAVRLAVKDFVDYAIEEAVIDIFSLPFKRIEDNKDVSYAVVAHTTVIADAIALIAEAGLKLKYLDIQELCLRNLAMLHPGSKQGALLLRLHANGGHVVFVRGSMVFMTRRLDLPLKDLLIGNVNISQWQQQTEQQKASILLDTLTLDLQRSIDYCSSIFRQAPINCVLFTPAEIEINNINEFLTKHLGIAAYTLDLSDIMQFKPNIIKAEQVKCLLAISAGLRHITVESNEPTDKSVSD